MTHDEYFRMLAEAREDELVVAALGMSAEHWWRRTKSTGDFYMHAAMGFASSFGLGLAMSLPESTVWVLDSDGGLCMNLGGLLTIAGAQPPNLKHFVLSNRCYQSISGASLVNTDHTDYATIARGAGLANVHRATTAAELAAILQATRGKREPCFVVCEVEPLQAQGATLDFALTMPYEGPEVKYRFGRSVEEKFGIPVFGPRGF